MDDDWQRRPVKGDIPSTARGQSAQWTPIDEIGKTAGVLKQEI
jgi:hypothetical protein